jgi:Dolichyl-phosphate-mannose-protein mannosyltransferase
MSLLVEPISIESRPPPRFETDRPTRPPFNLRPRVALSLLLAWSALLFFPGLTTGELCRTQGLRAILAQEMLHSGNWIVPTLHGQPLLTKPPGMYVAIALASRPAGRVTEWSARLPSAFAATVTVLLIYWYFGRCLGSAGGFIAAAITPACFMWLDKAPSAEIDMLQVAWVTAAILCFLRGLEPQTRSTCWWTFALLCVSGGFLTKWTAPAFFYGSVIPLLFWRRQWRLLFGRTHLVAVAVGGSVCLLWISLVITRTGWDVFAETVSREALQHLSPAHHPRPYPWGETLTHPFKLLAASLPWSLFALLSLRPGFSQLWSGRAHTLLQALHCWTWPNMVFWSLVPEHSPRHSFPLFPGLAGLAAFVWLALFQRKNAVAAWHALSLRRAWHRLLRFPTPFEDSGRATRTSRAYALFFCVLAAWVVVKLSFVQVVLPARNQGRDIRQKAAVLDRHVPAGETLYLFRLKDDGLMFYYGRPVRRLADPSQLPSSGEPVFCIVDATEWRQWSSPERADVVQSLQDQQGSPIVLLRVTNSAPGSSP